jgi:hypothetical protein
MNHEIEKVLLTLNELGDKYGTFQGLTLTPHGECHAVWAKHSEKLSLAELLHLVHQQPPHPDWQLKLGQALAHKARGELAEARALELEVTDILLQRAYQNCPSA